MRRLALIAVLAALLILPGTAQAVFPGENGKIAYSRAESCPGVTFCSDSLYVIGPDGSGRTRLTSTPARDVEPAWSADGSKIALSSNRDGNYEIYVVDANGANPMRLTANPAADSNPAWSPDGTKIAFNSNRGGSTGVYVMNADSTSPVLLQDHATRPAWSPDGTKIAFSGDGEIWVMNADGSGKQAVTPADEPIDNCGPVTESHFAPDWSPAGDRLAFVTIVFDPCNDGFAEYVFHTLKMDGSHGETQLFRTFEGCGIGPPVWSPDGSQITFSYCSLRVVNPDGSGLHSIDSECCGIGEPDWQPIVNRPPDCSGVAASRTVLTTVNRRLVAITLEGATDPDGDPVTLSVDGVTQDEPVTSAGDHTSPDAVDEGEGELRIRAERNPHGDGRVYRVTVKGDDGRGGTCSATVGVGVPRHHGEAPVDSAPPAYDSLRG